MNQPDLSVVVVNFNSAVWIRPMLESLFSDSFSIDGRTGTVEALVIDNASPSENHRALEALAQDPRVTVLRNTENVGYAMANIQGLRAATGRYHLVSNPDIHVQPGCLQHLLDAVRMPGVDVVGPMASFDMEGSVWLPPIELPDPYTESLTQIARYEPDVARFLVRHRAKQALRFWTAESPMPMPMLSGQFFLALRETFLSLGFFDPAYPLYYEDTDLFRAYHHGGRGLFHVPQARIVHHFSRSAMGRIHASMYRNRLGAQRYFKKWFGAAGYRAFEAAHGRAQTQGGDQECPFLLTTIRSGATAPTIDVPQHPGVYLETSGNPKFSLAAGVFPPVAGAFQFPAGFWGQLPPMAFWCRAVDPSSGDSLAVWRVEKCKEI